MVSRRHPVKVRGAGFTVAGTSSLRQCWMHFDLNVHMMVELVDDRHETVDGEAVQLGISDPHEFRLVDTGQGLCLTGRQIAVVQNADDLGGQDALGLLDVGVGITEIPKHVSAPMDQIHFVLLSHLATSPSTA